ncbi:MAG TPA: methyltransferase domain-containing protein [Candidatus Polarisedimenticolia bacterium]
MKNARLRPSSWMWKPGAGYYIEKPEALEAAALLPDLRRLRDRRIASLFDRHAGLDRGSRALEVGCGRSPWLPLLARRFGCAVAGIDLEPYAAELARANLAGAGERGEVFCRDAFVLRRGDPLEGAFDLIYSMGLVEHFGDPADRLAVLLRYLRPGGRIVTTVPNLQGVNWLLQRCADRVTLEGHVVHDPASLTGAHRSAGFETIASGYIGFHDGFLSSAAGARSRTRRLIHRAACRTMNLLGEGWIRLSRGAATPELRGLAPHVFYAGRRPATEA